MKRVCLLGILFFLCIGCNKKDITTTHRSLVTIAAVDDIVMGTDYPSLCLPSDKGAHFFRDSVALLSSADVAFGNLESVLAEGGNCVKDVSSRHQFAFRTPPEYAARLSEAGFDVVSLANNHVMDFGAHGLESTKSALRKYRVAWASRDGDIADIWVGDILVRIVAFTWGGAKRSICDPTSVLTEIKYHAEQSGILVVSIHCGAEGRDAIRVGKSEEYYLGEKRGNPRLLARGAIDVGADLVVMHGPHVPRGMEVYQDRLVAYSLGNFLTYGWSLNDRSRLAPILVARLAPDGSLEEFKVHSFIQRKAGYPEPDPALGAIRLMEECSAIDFPNTSAWKSGKVGFTEENE
jgi:hypothetical protein